jgi:hypothetical protein
MNQFPALALLTARRAQGSTKTAGFARHVNGADIPRGQMHQSALDAMQEHHQTD